VHTKIGPQPRHIQQLRYFREAHPHFIIECKKTR
jgi:hypothetical protein